jgi:outer membrane immunogenic protein
MDFAMNLPTKISGLGCFAFAATIATAGLSAAPAQAGGLPPAPPIYSWTGFYVGAHGGWGWGTTKIQDEILTGPTDPIYTKIDGPLAGAQAGFNYQMGNYVLGVEIDGSWTYIRASGAISRTGVIAATTNDIFGYNGLATATGRVGYTMGQWMAYAKGGAAWADFEIKTRNFSADPVSYSRNLFGWVGGAGIEVAFLRNVSAKAEYDYIRFSEDQLRYLGPNTISSMEHSIHVVKFGVNVRLGGDAGWVR